MAQAAAGGIRGRGLFLKSTASIVAVAFLSLSLQPLGFAADPQTAASSAQSSGADARLAKTLDTLEARLGKLEQKLTRGDDATAELTDIARLRVDLDPLDAAIAQDFEQTGQHLKAKGLPAIILERHAQALASYKQEMATLKANLDAINQAPSDSDRALKAKKAKEYLTAKQARPKRPPLDPNNLPTRALQPNKNNKPKLRKGEFHAAGLYDHPTVKLAALGDFTFDKLPGASDPAYLAATPEVVLSDAIKAKAAELEYNPVKIFNWIYANTEWLPTWGAIQSSDTALLTQKGNAFDLASLLIALLRASGIPARYVHGTIEIPADRFMNWAGGFTDPNGAWDLASASGIPITAVTAGGKITSFRMEHIWVEAALDFYPSGGAINKAADSWVRLDPSFKQYATERGYDMHARLGFDGEQFLMDYILNGADKTPYQYYSRKVIDNLNANIPDWTLQGLYGHERVSPLKPTLGNDLRELAASLPYKTLARGYAAGTIPDALRHKVTVEIANNPVYGSDASYTVALSDLGTQRLTLSFIPESAADDAVVDDYGSLFASPAYLVRIKPVLRKAGVTVAVGAGATLGEKQTLTLSFASPTVVVGSVVNQLTVGSYSAIVFQGLDASGSRPTNTMRVLRQHAELYEQGRATLDDTFGQLLSALGVLWFFDIKYERDFYSTTAHVKYTQLPSEIIVTADLIVSRFFGIPRSVQRGSYTLDADTDIVAVASIANGTGRIKDFMMLAGMTGSAWEHLELESAYGPPAVSSMKLLRSAADQSVPIHKVDIANISQVLPNLTLSADDINDIQNAVSAGKQVTVSQTEIRVGSYQGVGLVIFDPIRGSGGTCQQL